MCRIKHSVKKKENKHFSLCIQKNTHSHTCLSTDLGHHFISVCVNACTFQWKVAFQHKKELINQKLSEHLEQSIAMTPLSASESEGMTFSNSIIDKYKHL